MTKPVDLEELEEHWAVAQGDTSPCGCCPDDRVIAAEVELVDAFPAIVAELRELRAAVAHWEASHKDMDGKLRKLREGSVSLEDIALGRVTLERIYNGIGIKADQGHFGVAQRDGGIEVMLDGVLVWGSAWPPGGTGIDWKQQAVSYNRERAKAHTENESLRKVLEAARAVCNKTSATDTVEVPCDELQALWDAVCAIDAAEYDLMKENKP